MEKLAFPRCPSDDETKILCHNRGFLLFSLLVQSLFLAPLAKLLKLNLPFHFLLIFPAPIVGSFTLGAVEFYEEIL